MKFSFREAPGWFTQYLVDNYMDEFHNSVKDVRWENNMLNLVEAAVEFFEAKEIGRAHV